MEPPPDGPTPPPPPPTGFSRVKGRPHDPSADHDPSRSSDSIGTQLQLALHSDSSSDSSSSSSDSSSSAHEEEDKKDPSTPIYTHGGVGNALIKVATNRDVYGTWNRPMDFTITLIGYVLGIHNFFRFPHMCYKWGTLTFLIPYAIFVIFVGFPSVFMESAVGQFYGVGSSTAFRQLAPIISGVSYILAWNSFLNCWIFGLMLTWTRSYSGDSLSCLKGWMGCESGHYFNTPHCYTAILDDCCAGLSSVSDNQLCPEGISRSMKEMERNLTMTSEGLDPNVTLTTGGVTSQGLDPYARLYYDFKCISMNEFCELHGWEFVGGKKCRDKKGKSRSIYERRTHATSEYLYGFVLGMRKGFLHRSHKLAASLCSKDKGRKCSPKEYWDDDPSSGGNPYRGAVFMNKSHVPGFWAGNGTHMQLDPDSSSFIQLPAQAMTTVFFITFFLSVDILSVSIVTNIMATVPFCILIAIAVDAISKKGSTEGIDDMLSIRGIEMLWQSGDLWADALIQVIITSGVGNGALVSLASFNKYHHPFLFDVLIVTLLNVSTSLLATLICFCAIGSYVHMYGISTGFTSFIQPESTYSSVDFGFLVWSYFLTLIDRNDFEILVLFFMLSSFPTDTTIRLAQNMLDTAVQILPRIRHHSTMALLATSFFFLVALLPITRNGGIILFLEFEYCAHRFAMPIVALIEILSIAWIYRAERLMDDAELLGVSLPLFRIYIRFSLKLFAPLALVLLLVYNGALAQTLPRIRTLLKKNRTDAVIQSIVGWIFSLTPPILLLLSVLKQLTSVPRRDWADLFIPMISWDRVRGAAKKQRKQKIRQRRKLKALKDEHDPSVPSIHRLDPDDKKEGKIVIASSKKGIRHTIDAFPEHATGAEALFHNRKSVIAKVKGKVKVKRKKSKVKEDDVEGAQGSSKPGKPAKPAPPPSKHNAPAPDEDEELRRMILDVKTRRVGDAGSVVELDGGSAAAAAVNGGAMAGDLNPTSKPEADNADADAISLTSDEIKARRGEGDKMSLDSAEVANWKKFIMWNEIIAHLEDWPDRLDDSEVESEGSSVDTSEEDEEELALERERERARHRLHQHVQRTNQDRDKS